MFQSEDMLLVCAVVCFITMGFVGLVTEKESAVAMLGTCTIILFSMWLAA